jgi:hypothetical protein
MIEITWRDFKRMIFWGRKMYLSSICLNQWVQQDLNWMTSYTVQYISDWRPFCHLQARNKQEPRIMRQLRAIKSECKSRRVTEIILPKPDAVKQMEIGSMQLMLQWLHEDASLTSSATQQVQQLSPDTLSVVARKLQSYQYKMFQVQNPLPLSTQNGIFKCS